MNRRENQGSVNTSATETGQANGRPRKPAPFSEALTKRLRSYAVAAGAAGVGLVSPQPAKADIIFTPANIRNPTSLDLNHDGTADFTFSTGSSAIACGGSGCLWEALLSVQGAAGNRVVRSSFGPGYALGLGKGSLIPGRRYLSSRGVMAFIEFKTHNGVFYSTVTARGNWPGAGLPYLGLSFLIDGKVHYGWAELTVSLPGSSNGFSDTLLGYAYETNPGQPIRAGQTTETPEPGTLGLLALGSLGIAAWRRRKAGSGSSEGERIGSSELEVANSE